MLWYIGLSTLIVWSVFQSSGIDYRLVAVGSLLPLAVDLPFGHTAVGHTMVFGAGLLLVVMVGTIGRPRLVRRRWLCAVIGVLCGLGLSGAWMNSDVVWWPLGGSAFVGGSLFPIWWAAVPMELVGAFACWWVVGRFGLYERERWDVFLRSGRLTVVSE